MMSAADDVISVPIVVYVNPLRPWQDGHNFADILKRIFMKLFHVYLNSTEIWTKGSNYQYISIGSDDGLAPIRRQVII